MYFEKLPTSKTSISRMERVPQTGFMVLYRFLFKTVKTKGGKKLLPMEMG